MSITVSRRELLTASALLLAGPGLALRAVAAASSPASPGPLVLCWNENPYGPSPAACEAVARSIADGCRYPSDEDLDALSKALAQREGTRPDHIAIGTGSGELLCALGLLCARDGGELIAAEPTYLELPEYAQRAGAVVRFVPVDGQLRHDLDAMAGAVTARTRALYLCNPNNPTGTAVTAAQIRTFVAALPPYVTVIVDEAYMDFTTGAGVQSVSELVEGERRVVILRTFSKIHGMAGLRLGYAVARPDVAKTLREATMTTPNILVVRAAPASLTDTAFLADTRRRILASRARITAELRRLNLRYAEPEGNFIFFDTGVPHAKFKEGMKARNILVGRYFPPFSTWCRVTIGTESEVDTFLAELPGALKA
jgi:histidinol-phosphate aminotransferase